MSQHRTGRRARTLSATALAAVLALGACGILPRVGPSKGEIYEGSVLRSGDAFVVAVNDRVTRATAVIPALGFDQAFLTAGTLGADTIRPGDSITLTIFENVEEGLLAGAGANAAVLSELQVDEAGMIFVPYAGRVRAAGQTPDGLRRIITARLDEQTPDPQVLVQRVAGEGAAVSIVFPGGGSGLVPLDRTTRTLLPVLAAAGAVPDNPEVARIRITRHGRSAEVWYDDVLADPRLDIALRDGDRVIVENPTLTFTALGATGAQTQVEFDQRDTSALEAIAQVGGLSPNSADPTGVFVLRNEPEAIARQILARGDLTGPQRMVYVLDLTRPNGMFEARDFLIRDGDTVYVTEAPYTQVTRIITSITGATGAVTGLADTVAPR
ncbi:MAG: polysaccharide biosynthesis/export family protein [Shimia sp.]